MGLRFTFLYVSDTYPEICDAKIARRIPHLFGRAPHMTHRERAGTGADGRLAAGGSFGGPRSAFFAILIALGGVCLGSLATWGFGTPYWHVGAIMQAAADPARIDQ